MGAEYNEDSETEEDQAEIDLIVQEIQSKILELYQNKKDLPA